METQRINFFIEVETLEVIDAFAKLNDRSRTYVLNDLLRPALPTLKQLLELSDELHQMTDTDRLTALAKLTATGDKLANTVRAMPKHIEGIKND